jgi:hypothetical protein
MGETGYLNLDPQVQGSWVQGAGFRFRVQGSRFGSGFNVRWFIFDVPNVEPELNPER